jgi:uncharacterized protein (TIGR02266 family)
VRVLVDYEGPEGMRWDYATTLGAGGLFIQTDAPFARGERFVARFRLDPEAPLHTIASRVAWSVPPPEDARHAPGMGVEFTDAAAAASLARELDRFQA